MAKGRKNCNQVVMGAAAAEIRPGNNDRSSIMIENTGAVTVFLGTSSAVTSANGKALLAGARLTDTESVDAYWGITAGAAGAVDYLEVIKLFRAED